MGTLLSIVQFYRRYPRPEYEMILENLNITKIQRISIQKLILTQDYFSLNKSEAEALCGISEL